MSDAVIISILGIAGALLSGTIGHVLGQRAERRKQSLIIRAEMLNPIDEWLKGAEKIVGMFSDTLASIGVNSRLPINYDLEERRKASNFMAEKTNEVFGIIASKSLQIGRTKRLSQELNGTISFIDTIIKYQLLPTESEIVERSNNGSLTQAFILDAINLKPQADRFLQRAYSLVAKIRTALT